MQVAARAVEAARTHTGSDQARLPWGMSARLDPKPGGDREMDATGDIDTDGTFGEFGQYY